ncbi:MAG: glycoside hydrolase family 3 C-terminal domain-containing protein [Alistipes sp.]|nr:glycoside hydrolase family 3 C-terminal domain-containing protein [Alistipes sp.]
MRNIYRLIAVAVCLLAASCGRNATPVYLDDRKPLEKRVEDALSRMTLDEKIAMIHAQSKFSSPGVPRLGIPEVWCTDGPHGIREEVFWDEWKGAGWTNDLCTAFPALTCLAASWDPEMSAIYGKAIGEEARYRNKNVLLGPGVNIYRTPLNGRNFEYMGEDPYLASVMVVPYIQNVQKQGVATCVKHFALNNQEFHRHDVDVTVSDRALYEIYLPAFKAAVEEGKAWSIMGSYNLWDGEHCCHNHRLLVDILRGEWNFDGAVISDWGGVSDTRQSLENGLDLEFGTWTDGLARNSGGSDAYNNYYMANPLKRMIESGEGDEAKVDDKVRNILRLIFRTTMDRNRPYGSFATEEHAEVSRRIAENGIVLLKNDNEVLPLLPDSVSKILVVGENATRKMTKGGGSSSLKVKYEVLPLDGLKNVYGEEKIIYMKGYSSDADEKVETLDELKAAAAECDAVLFFGGLNKKKTQDSEGRDRLEFGLPYGQDAVIEALSEANPRLAAVIISGNAVAMDWAAKVPAIVEGWYLGSEAGNALANVLSGKVNPSGKLPFTYYAKLEDCGAHAFGEESYPGITPAGDTDAAIYAADIPTEQMAKKIFKQRYCEDIFVGYRWTDLYNLEPTFPFGHGLSYTTFEYSNMRLDKNSMRANGRIKVSADIRNTGKVRGAEVVQLYVGDNEASVERPIRELKGFRKVFLDPNEKTTVEFVIDRSALQYFDAEQHCWMVETGTFTASIGSSSRDLRCKAEFELR